MAHGKWPLTVFIDWGEKIKEGLPMHRFLAGTIAVTLLLIVTITVLPMPRLSRGADDLQGSYRFERNGWIYVHVEGPPERLGYQHGYLLAQEIDDLLSVIKPMWMHTTHRDWNFYRQAAERMLWPKIDSEYQHEIDGIVAGMNARGEKADRWDIVALNALEELPDYYVPWLDVQEGRTPETH